MLLQPGTLRLSKKSVTVKMKISMNRFVIASHRRWRGNLSFKVLDKVKK